AAQVLLSAATKTSGASSAKLTTKVVTTTAGGQEQTLQIQGAMNFATKDLQMDMTVPSVGALRVILIGKRFMYEQLPPSVAKQLPGHKPWIKIDLDALGKLSGMNLGSLLQAKDTDPSQGLQFLAGVSSDARDLGVETIDGEQTHHFRATV